MPGVEVGLEPLGGAAAEQVEIPEREAVELARGSPRRAGQVAVEIGRVEQAGLELAERLQQRVGEAAVRAERVSPFSVAPPTARRTISARW